MKIYTKSGDKGKTSLLSGKRVAKNNIRIEAYGSVDELNSFIGHLRAYDELNREAFNALLEVQKVLFRVGSFLAMDENKFNIKIEDISDADIELLEKEIDKMNEILPKLTNFIIPTGSKATGIAHICRTVCRRSERNVVKLMEKEEVDNNILIYLNRLSDYFFVLARMITKDSLCEEITI